MSGTEGISPLYFCCALLSALPKGEAFALMREAAAGGISLFCTSEAAGPFENERLVGEGLARERLAGRVLAATAFGCDFRKGGGALNSRPEHIREALEGSLARLRLPRADFLFQQAEDPAVPPEEAAGEVARLIAEGKAGGFGLCSPRSEYARRAAAECPVSLIMAEASPWEQGKADSAARLARELGARLLLWGRFAPLPSARPGAETEVKEIESRLGVGRAAASAAWLLRRYPGASVFAPATDSASLAEALAAAGMRPREERTVEF